MEGREIQGRQCPSGKMRITEFYESPSGDIYSISLSSENGGLIADDIRSRMKTEGVVVVDIELNRIQGTNPTTTAVLARTGEMIAEYFLSHPDTIMCYFCDFLSQLPFVSRRNKSMSVQEYRHHLFSNMFDRYVSQHHIEGVNLAVLTIEGASDTYYVHVVARDEHLSYIPYINSGIQRDFGKP